LLASQALSRDLLCGDNDLLSCIANFYPGCLPGSPFWTGGLFAPLKQALGY